jgi:hypothetical protein
MLKQTKYNIEKCSSLNIPSQFCPIQAKQRKDNKKTDRECDLLFFVLIVQKCNFIFLAKFGYAKVMLCAA